MPIRYTRGFIPDWLGQHFDDHGQDFGATSEDEYETLADLFLGGPKPRAVHECLSKTNNDLIRYNPNTNEFGILSADRIIRTYYKLNKGYNANLVYFRKRCEK